MSNHSNINLRSDPILAVLIHSLLHALPAGMLFTKQNKNIALSRVIGTYPIFFRSLIYVSTHFKIKSLYNKAK